MRVLKHRGVALMILAATQILPSSLLYGAPPPFNSRLEPIKTSKAFKAYQMRPKTELSKILFLIDRFKEADIKIIYDGIHFEPQFAVRIAKWFLSQNYRKETAKEWIMLYCNQSLVEHKLIWVKDSGEGFKLSREVLLQELKALEAVLAETALNEDKRST